MSGVTGHKISPAILAEINGHPMGGFRGYAELKLKSWVLQGYYLKLFYCICAA